MTEAQAPTSSNGASNDNAFQSPPPPSASQGSSSSSPPQASPPKPTSPPTPPSSSPPPSSNEPSPPPPGSPPLSSPPIPPPPKTPPPAPSPPTTTTPPSSSPPTPPPSNVPASPPPPAPKSRDHSSPPPTLPPPVIVPPPPNSLQATPPPPQVVTPPVPQTPAITPPPPSLPTPGIEVPPTPSDGKLPNNPPHKTPSSAKASSPGSSSSSGSRHSGDNFDAGGVIGVTLATVALIALGSVFFVVIRKRKKRMNSPAARKFSNKPDIYYASKPPPSPSAPGSLHGSFRGHGYHPVRSEPSIGGFTYEELRDITNGFSGENILGEGGFGCVYKGCLPDGRTVAVKQLKVGSGQGEREFRAEVDIISRVHHRHLVSLVGYCIEEQQRLLVYDYLPNKTLEYHLHGKGLPVMDWPKRVKIAIGSARGLAYLHEDCYPRIIHRDIKSANILLDDSFEAQVADFGLAKLTNDAHTHVSTRVMGTFGYMAPEYASSGKLTDRSDVFSFGVVLLELITGRKPVDPSQPLGDESLVEWARPLLVHALETGDFEELVDPMLEKKFMMSEMLRMIEVAAACVRHSASKRPRMVQVLRSLDSDVEMSDLSNGMKFGQSTVYNSGQYSAEIRRFQRLALGSDVFSSGYGLSTTASENLNREAIP